ncbi:NAD-dependent epimerase/dehydratase family protein [Flagellimonas algicola]|uniref:NAD-dependent epimerase/dehydratase family protein n=1 Tax=Flagellimonas algicola TaxID=2583815 RepID=A0ABY2WM46_9FLAO|nr:NAD-dependent epimerase/dehydratase family protein [Allomuricauda algicola]TMU55444.1 NAD-dependent epimerase/dehydratase family protein [Allomuricauda algicola]
MILVTGGTGLIGSHLLFQLVQDGKSVKATYRTKKSLKKISKVFDYYTEHPETLLHKITWVQADITDVGTLENAFKDVTQVYHCAALISFDPRQLDQLIQANSEATANMVNLCIANGVKKLCYVSSIAAIGPSVKGKMATEENEWNDTKVSVYGLTKHDAELEVWRGSQEGLAVVVVNPGVVLGPGFWKSGSGSFFTYAQKGKKHFIPGGTGFVSVNDVTRAMTQLMDSGIRNERFILVNENLTYSEFFKRICGRLGVTPPDKPIPFWMLELFWRLDGLRSKLRGKRRRLTKNMVKGMYRREIYNNTKIKKALDFTYDNLDETLDFCCEKFKS